jgi:hypothetical protein
MYIHEPVILSNWIMKRRQQMLLAAGFHYELHKLQKISERYETGNSSQNNC